MFFSSKNCRIDIDGNPIYANEASISTDASINSNILINESNPRYYVPENGLLSSLKISYYLTGRDFLKDYISDDTRLLKVNFGGLYFNSGCITSYTLEAEPNNPIVVNTEITFFENLLGSFSPTYTNIINETPILNYSNTLISGTELNDLDETIGFSYNSSMDVRSSYKDDNTVLNSRIVLGPQQSTLRIRYSDLNTPIYVSGKDASVNIVIKNSGNLIHEVFNITGKIISKNLNVNENQYLFSEIVIRQDSVTPLPIISGFSPTNGIANGNLLVSVTGSNFKNISQVLYGNVPIRFLPRNQSSIWAFPVSVPRSGKFTIFAQGGAAESSNFFVSTDLSMGEF